MICMIRVSFALESNKMLYEEVVNEGHDTKCAQVGHFMMQCRRRALFY